MRLEFVYPWILYALCLVPAFAGLALWRRLRLARGGSPFVSAPMRTRLVVGPSTTQTAGQLITGMIAFAMLVLALARPRMDTPFSRPEGGRRALVIALDVSRSMLADDVHPNRLERARLDLKAMVSKLSGQRAALLAFRHDAVLLCPLTTDVDFLLQSLADAGPEAAPPGPTRIDVALHAAGDLLRRGGPASGSVLLVSDGENLAGDPLPAAEKLAAQGIPVFTVGMGTPAGARIPLPGLKHRFVAHRGQDVVSRRRADLLQAIARTTRGAYLPLEAAASPRTWPIVVGLSSTPSQDMVNRATTQHDDGEAFQPFLLPAVLLLGMVMLLGRSRARKKGPALNKTAGLLLLAAGLAPLAALGAADAQAGREPPPSAAPPAERTGQGQAIDTHPDLRYNTGVTLYRVARYREAQAHFRAVVALEKGRRADTFFALGCGACAIAQTGQKAARNPQEHARLLETAAEAWIDALRLDPEHGDARYNLALVLKLLPAARAEAARARTADELRSARAGALVQQMLTAQQDIVRQAHQAMADRSPARLYAFEKLAQQQEANVLRCPALEAKLKAGRVGMVRETGSHRSAAAAGQAMQEAAALFAAMAPKAMSPAQRAEALLRTLCDMLEPLPQPSAADTSSHPGLTTDQGASLPADEAEQHAAPRERAAPRPQAAAVTTAATEPLPAAEEVETWLELVLQREANYVNRRQGAHTRLTSSAAGRDW